MKGTKAGGKRAGKKAACAPVGAKNGNVGENDFLENRLSGLVGKFGDMEEVYGGLRITVKNDREFDYHGVLMEILECRGMAVAVELHDNKIVIVAI